MWSEANTARTKILLRSGIVLLVGNILREYDERPLFVVDPGPDVPKVIVRALVREVTRHCSDQTLIGGGSSSLVIGKAFNIGVLSVAMNKFNPDPGIRATIQVPSIFGKGTER